MAWYLHIARIVPRAHLLAHELRIAKGHAPEARLDARNMPGRKDQYIQALRQIVAYSLLASALAVRIGWVS